jgi:hypothetical protein
LANKTIYVREIDLPLWEQARARLGERGISSMFATFLRETLAAREGFLHVLSADGKNDPQKGQFAVMFAPFDSEGAMKPHYCEGLTALSRFLEKLGLQHSSIEDILAKVKRERAASERMSFVQSVIQMFDPLAENVEYELLKTVSASHLGPGHLVGRQFPWGQWILSVKAREPECTQADLLSAFKRLWLRGILRLTKPDQPPRYEGTKYSGRERDDDMFFFTGDFNAVLTDDGQSYWSNIRGIDWHLPLHKDYLAGRKAR